MKHALSKTELPAQDASPRILVIEDDAVLNAQIAGLLRDVGYNVQQCYDGEDGLALAVGEHFDLIILDVMLPGRDGLSLLQILRRTRSDPVIIVSARHAEEERIRGLSAGADDYLAKPFNVEELKLRVDAVLRRTLSTETVEPDQHHLDGLTVDRRQQEVRAYDKVLELTPTQLHLLWTLISNRGETLSKPFLYATVLNRSYSSYDRSLDMHMSRVRRRLNEAGWAGTRLQTVHGEGYCLK
ncbi:MAG: response regulator transcription factor [Pseudomonadota bacterium]